MCSCPHRERLLSHPNPPYSAQDHCLPVLPTGMLHNYCNGPFTTIGYPTSWKSLALTTAHTAKRQLFCNRKSEMNQSFCHIAISLVFRINNCNNRRARTAVIFMLTTVQPFLQAFHPHSTRQFCWPSPAQRLQTSSKSRPCPLLLPQFSNISLIFLPLSLDK